jgi:hypothetical protein
MKIIALLAFFLVFSTSIVRGQFRDDADYPQEEMNQFVYASERVAHARIMLRIAESDLGATIDNAKEKFERSSEYQEDKAAEDKDYADFLAARQNSMKCLLNNPKYQALISLREELADRLLSRKENKISQDEIIAIATLRMQYGEELSKMEKDIIEADSTVADEQRSLVVSSGKFHALKMAWEEGLRDDKQVLAARNNLENAEVELVDSEAKLNAASYEAGSALNYSYYLHQNENYTPYWDNGDYGYWHR